MKTGLNRDTTDAFYTVPSVALMCIQYFNEHIKPSSHDVLIEPSAGSGSFSTQIQPNFRHLYSFDLYPQSPFVISQDFLKIKETSFFQEIVSKNRPIHIIGNPPFGRQAATARSFIRLCSEFATSISFILPKSFKKQSFQKAFPLCFSLLFQIDLPDPSFTINDNIYSVPCVFQIWKKMPYDRIVELPQEPQGFVFCKKEDSPDIAIRRVGVYAGKLLEDNLQQLSGQSHYFIKMEGLTQKQFKKKFGKIAFEHDNTVGPRSISKQEIICKMV